MELKKGYKQTDLGVIPDDWGIKEFADVMDGFSSGQTPYRAVVEYYKGDIPWITSGELNYNIIIDTIEKITIEGAREANLKKIPKGTFLFAITGLEAAGTRGSCAITGIEATTNQSCMALYPKKGLLTTPYLYHYYVRYGNELAFKYCQGTKQQSYTGGIAKKLPIIVPPSLSEQTAIANALSDMDALISQTEKFIKKKKAIKQGAMQELLKPKDGWVTKKLGELVSVIKSGGTPLTSIKEYYNGEIPFLSISDMTSQGKYLHRTSSKISQNGLDNSSSWLVQKESLIYSMYASVGFVSLNKIDIAISQAVLGMKFKDIMNLEFMYYTLLNMQKSVLKFVGEGTQKNLNAASVKQFDIKYPSIFEQEAIADILSNMDSDIDLQIKKLTKLKQQKQGMMQALLTGKIRLI
jgi:type I restriction enzyme S subunit